MESALGNFMFIPHREEVPLNGKVESDRNGEEDPIHLKVAKQEMELETKISIEAIKHENPLVFRFAHCGVKVKKPKWNFLNKVKTATPKAFWLMGKSEYQIAGSQSCTTCPTRFAVEICSPSWGRPAQASQHC
jgi:hypothetical protein